MTCQTSIQCIKPCIQHVQSWFHNHSHGTTSGSGSRGILKVKAAPKMLQGWQAYHHYHLTYDLEWRGKVDQVWEDYQLDWLKNNPGVKPPKKRFDVANEFIKEKYAAETPDKVNEVYEYHKKLKEEGEMGETENGKYQE